MEKAVGSVVLWVSSMFVSSILYAVTLVVLWGWFVVPLFHAPTLSIPIALGLSLLVTRMTVQPDLEQRTAADAKARLVRGTMYSVMFSLGCLLFGYVYHLFV